MGIGGATNTPQDSIKWNTHKVIFQNYDTCIE